jgi:branched-chain amino acid aminotransferase
MTGWWQSCAGVGYRVPGVGCRATGHGVGHRVPGTWCLVTGDADSGQRTAGSVYLMRLLIDGFPAAGADASVSVFDWVVVRGFGVFEVVRSYDGILFRLDRHLDRLERSAAALGIGHPDREEIGAWAASVAASEGGGLVRIILTGGGRDRFETAPPRTIIMWEPLPPIPDRLALLPTVAPWHPGTDTSGFPGVKWVSYAPNMMASDRAKAAGFSDALLVTVEGTVLEGPTFTIAWAWGGRIETPSLDLGILASITREVMVECAAGLGADVAEGRYPLGRLFEADEVFALSTMREIVPVERIGDRSVPLGDVGARMAGALAALVAGETGR